MYYDTHTVPSPVTNDTTIRIVLILILMAAWSNYFLDVKGAFLMGEFYNEEEIYIPVPRGFERFYLKGSLWLLLKTMHGLKKVARMFWKILLKYMRSIGFKKSWTDPCLYYSWTLSGLMSWLSWIDDFVCVGNKGDVLNPVQGF